MSHVRLSSALLLIFAPLALFAQPVAPTAGELAELRAREAFAPRAVTPTLSVNIASREEVRQFYRAIYSASNNVAMGWTGDYNTGNAGDTAAAFKQATLLRINFYRALVGVPAAITFNTTYSSQDQQAALMMSANNTLQHTGIPTTWTFYTSAGATAAANSNLSLGAAGPDAITGYMRDDGSNNAEVGHRRWIEYPQTQQMGTGDVPGNGSLYSANATWVIDSQYGTARPATRTTQVPYPPAGYVPYQLVWPRWSFTYPNADFSSATVTMTLNGQSVPTAIQPLAGNVGEPTLVWVYNNLDGNSSTAHPKPSSDTTYTVNVGNVKINGTAQNFSYNVTVFDPDVAGSDFAPVAITGSSNPTVGVANSYTVAVPSFAGSFDWRTLQLASYSKTYGAEAGLDGITTTTTSGYNVVQNSIVGAGSAAFRLAHPTPPTDQVLLLPETFLVTSNSAAVAFLSRVGYSGDGEVARLQVSTDEGSSWTDLYTRTGDNTSGEGSFVARTASLSAYNGQTVRIRFAYTYTAGNSYYPPQGASIVGWYLDNIAVTGVQNATPGTPTNVAGSSSFSFTPSSAGTVALQARGVLFGTYPLGWGPATTVTATTGSGGGGGGNPSAWLSNLSVSATQAQSQTLTVGLTVSGGAENVLVRAAGPALTALGFSGAMTDPRLDLYQQSNSALILSNDDWAPALATTFTQVGAFSFPSGSKDAAFVQNLNGGYSVRANGTGPGLVLVEAYALGSGSAQRMTNISTLNTIATGGTLTAGFYISGTGTMKVLIRGVGPSLVNYGYTTANVLTNPRIDVFQGNAQTPFTGNDDWDSTLLTTMRSVGAFDLIPGSKDAAMILTLNAGSIYSARVSGVDGGGGNAIVEVYEVP